MSGGTFTVTSGVDNARTGTGSQFADVRSAIPELSSDRPKSERLAQWFNTSAFTVNALGTFGNAGRNSLRGPDYQTLDLGLIRRSTSGRGSARSSASRPSTR